MRTGTRLSSLEVVLAAGVLLVAFAARSWALGGIGINHYDEGVYVISAVGMAASPPELFPNQIVFSPPFYFATAGLMHWIFGADADRVAILVNIVIGSLTVGAVWAVGRAWFGGRAALIAAALLALNPLHILLSRVALTDVAFSFWFVLALGAVVWAVDRRDYRIAVPGGVLIGMAWNTKYHGWFVLLITGAALLPDLWGIIRRRTSARPLTVWLTAAVVAGLCYLPWAFYMGTASGDGGYGGIVRYFAAMLRGEWLANVIRHAGQQAFMEGALSRAAPLAALGAGLLAGRGTATGRTMAVAGALAAGALLAGQAGVALILALLSLPVLLREFGSYRYRVIICWVGLWVVAAPFYHPYARLLLPFVIATFLLAGLVLDRLLGGSGSTPEGDVAAPSGAVTGARSRLRAVVPGWAAGLVVLAAAAALSVAAPLIRQDAGNPWRSSRDLAELAVHIAARVPEDQPIYVLGEPPLTYYLRELDRDVPGDLRPRALAALTGPAYVVAGVYSQRAPQLRNALTGFGDRLTVAAVVRFEPNDLRVLDDLEPDEAREFRREPDSTFDLTLYRLVPAR
jgi:4-amino-4-deoxy-L-arabinose transferase-like glycosyltransferase